MAAVQDDKPDHWDAQTYKAAADFVHKLTTKVLVYLDPQPTDHILDLGCGDGALTAKLAEVAREGSVHGIDLSGNFIGHARATHCGTHANLSFELQDCSRLDGEDGEDGEEGGWAAAHAGRYDRVFSNAALHWILREPGRRRAATFRAVYDVLRPGGTFAFEMGGAGNVAEVHAALVAALVRAGVPAAEARDASPWFFPSDVLLERLLTEAGFRVEKTELEYRPTRLESGPGGGVEGWVRLMGQVFLDKVGPEKREAVVQETCEVLKGICHREEGGEWLGYVRARGIARKP